jgi:hypothetical protein
MPLFARRLPPTASDNGRMRLLGLVLVVATGACSIGPRVTLPQPPPPHAPWELRYAAFAALRSRGIGDNSHFTLMGGGNWTTYLGLTNRLEVYEPEDLLAIVPYESECAQAAIASDHARERRRLWDLLLYSSLAIGGMTLAGGIVAQTRHQDTPIPPAAIITLGGIALGVGGTFGLVNRVRSDRKYDRERTRAFETYDKALADRLRICVANNQIVDCDAGRAPGDR